MCQAGNVIGWPGQKTSTSSTTTRRSPGSATRNRDADGEVETAEAPGLRGRSVASVVFVLPYLALTVGWIFAVQQLSSGSASLFGEILWQFGEFLAMLAAPLWFAAAVTLTRQHRPLVRVGWLALGMLVLLPWPLVLQFVAALQYARSLS
jgi:hypothetical protein